MKRFFAALLLLIGIHAPTWADETIFIDVRSADEYAEGHIDGALLMPHDQIADLIGKANISKESSITLYCRSGRRAEMARQTLEKLGYTNVINAGGYDQLAAKQREACTAESC